MIWPLISPDSGPLQPVVLLNQTNEKDDEDIDDDDDTQNDDEYGSVVMTIFRLIKGSAKTIITITNGDSPFSPLRQIQASCVIRQC